MEDIVRALTRATTVVTVADVAVDALEVVPLFGADESLDFVEVALITSAEVVQANNALIQFEQGFKQVAADEARNARDEPGLRLSLELLLQ
jgi:hypothetical protein